VCARVVQEREREKEKYKRRRRNRRTEKKDKEKKVQPVGDADGERKQAPAICNRRRTTALLVAYPHLSTAAATAGTAAMQFRIARRHRRHCRIEKSCCSPHALLHLFVRAAARLLCVEASGCVFLRFSATPKKSIQNLLDHFLMIPSTKLLKVAAV
jgi:hypothetical protein